MISVLGADVTRKVLRNIPLPDEDMGGSRWKPIQHGELVDLIIKRLKKKGFGIKDERWSLAGGDMRLIGAIDLGIPKSRRKSLGVRQIKGVDYALGVRHSNDQMYALTFSVGATIVVCHNGLISGEFIVKKRHTTNTNLRKVVRRGINVFSKRLPEVVPIIDRMQDIDYTTEIHRRGAAEALMRAGLDRVMPWSRIGKVAREYANPTFEPFQPRNAWSLYNAATYVVQETSPERQMFVLDRFRDTVLQS